MPANPQDEMERKARELLADTRELWTRPTHLDDVTFDAIAKRIATALRAERDSAEVVGLKRAADVCEANKDFLCARIIRSLIPRKDKA